jgi:NAD-dependent deacetylase
MDDALLSKLAAAVSQRLGSGSKRLLFITGAGLSAESGLPTYRGVSGLYTDAQTEDGVPIEVALSGPMFRRNPALTWRHIARIEQSVRGARPNLAHEIIAALERRHDVVVLTQNVDGLHRAAGSSAIIDIHGDCHHLLCTRCEMRWTCESYAELTLPPECEVCKALVRPDVVLFEEALAPAKLARLRAELTQGFDAVFSIGTSSLFAYVAEPVILAMRRGWLSVEINPEETPVTQLVDAKFACAATRALHAIFGTPSEL